MLSIACTRNSCSTIRATHNMQIIYTDRQAPEISVGHIQTEHGLHLSFIIVSVEETGFKKSMLLPHSLYEQPDDDACHAYITYFLQFGTVPVGPDDFERVDAKTDDECSVYHNKWFEEFKNHPSS